MLKAARFPLHETQFQMVGVSEYQIFDNVSPADPTWKQFREIVESEGWKSDDHSVMELTPILSSTRSVVAKDADGNYVGSVVWNEYDGIAFIGFYLLREEHRGKGIGSVIWKQALQRMPQAFTIGLRAVPHMAPRYQSKDTPIEGPKLNEFSIHWKDMLKICSIHRSSSPEDKTVHSIRELNKEVFAEFLEYDRKVTGKDRSDFLRRFYIDLKFTAGNILLNKNGNIVAAGGITSTSTKESHMFKIAPIYANSLDDALLLCEKLVEFAGAQDKEAIVLFHILSGTRGEKEFLPLLVKADIPTLLTGITLFSKPIDNPINTNAVYIAHNNSGHYDV